METSGNEAVIGGVCILRYVKYSVCSTSTELLVGNLAWWYAALQSYGLGSIPRALIFFFRSYIFFVFTIKFTLYFLLFLTFSLYYATYSVERFLSLITVNVRCWLVSLSGYL